MDLFLPTLSGYRHPGDQDFNALPRFRQQGIGTRLMDEAERKVSERSGVAGIGVGLSPDYGAAQRLYALRGYAPDGKGLTSNVLHVSLLTWSNPAPRPNTPVDNSQNPTIKAKNRASQSAAEIFTFV